jgi:hypothetical protein
LVAIGGDLRCRCCCRFEVRFAHPMRGWDGACSSLVARVCLPTRCETGLLSSSHLFWWFCSTFGLCRSTVSRGCWWSDPLSPDDVMASGHLLQPVRSVSIQHVNVFGMRLLVASKNCEAPSSGRRSASSYTWLLRSSTTRTTGRILQWLGCNFCFLHVCLSKMWNVNFKKYM